MRHFPDPIVIAFLLALCALLAATSSDAAETADEASRSYFAVEIKVGPNWDAARPPAEQAFFAEHSANLRRLRNAGHIVMGSRYSDIGLVIFSADSAEAVRAFMQQDPAMSAGTFRYEIHPINIFYPWRDATGS